MSQFKQFIEENFEKLDLYTTAITRAHGKSHPEAFEVREIFEAIKFKVNKSGGNNLALDDEFHKLRQITAHYKIPNDVCETYESVYKMLSALDDLYHTF